MRGMSVLLALLSGCVSAPLPTSEMARPSKVHSPDLTVAAAGKARVTVKRDIGGMGAQKCAYLILIDGKSAVDLDYGQGATLYLDPGERIVSLRFDNVICRTADADLAVIADARREKVVRVVPGNQGTVALQQATP